MKKKIVSVALAIALLFGVCNFIAVDVSAQYTTNIAAFSYNGYKIPAYDGDAWENVNGSDPNFTKSEKTTTPFEKYSSLDSLGRSVWRTQTFAKKLCQQANAVALAVLRRQVGIR